MLTRRGYVLQMPPPGGAFQIEMHRVGVFQIEIYGVGEFQIEMHRIGAFY